MAVPGSKNGPYEVLRKIFGDDSGATYLVRAVGGATELHMRRLDSTIAQHPGNTEQFLDLCKRAHQLDLGNVCAVQDYGADGQGPFAIYKPPSGCELVEFVAGMVAKSLPQAVDIVAHIIADVGEALCAVYAARGDAGQPLGIERFGVSAETICISKDGLPRLLFRGIVQSQGGPAHSDLFLLAVALRDSLRQLRDAGHERPEALLEIVNRGVSWKRRYGQLQDFTSALRQYLSSRPPTFDRALIADLAAEFGSTSDLEVARIGATPDELVLARRPSGTAGEPGRPPKGIGAEKLDHYYSELAATLSNEESPLVSVVVPHVEEANVFSSPVPGNPPRLARDLAASMSEMDRGLVDPQAGRLPGWMMVLIVALTLIFLALALHRFVLSAGSVEEVPAIRTS